MAIHIDPGPLLARLCFQRRSGGESHYSQCDAQKIGGVPRSGRRRCTYQQGACRGTRVPAPEARLTMRFADGGSHGSPFVDDITDDARPMAVGRVVADRRRAAPTTASAAAGRCAMIGDADNDAAPSYGTTMRTIGEGVPPGTHGHHESPRDARRRQSGSVDFAAEALLPGCRDPRIRSPAKCSCFRHLPMWTSVETRQHCRERVLQPV
jgi:hypothetical protein